MTVRKVIEVSSKYKDRNGVEKWKNAIVGSAFLYEDGNLSLELDPGISISSLQGVRISIKEPFQRDGGNTPL